jgi:hypothetical protein
MDDRHPGRGLVALLGEVRALHAVLGVVERVEVAGGQGLDRLRADQHPGVLDDHEHLPDAVVHAADEGADRRQARVAAEGQLAGRGDLQPHLVLEVGDLDAVALPGRAVGVHVVLGDKEQGQALSAGPRALGPGEHQVEDVLRHVVLGAGDEPLHALDVPGPVWLLNRLGPARTDVGARVRLGQHHRRTPLALDRELGEALLLGGAEQPQDRRERRAVGVHPQARVGPEDEAGDAPLERPRHDGAAKLRRHRQPPPLPVHEGAVRLLEGRGQRHVAGGLVEDRRIAVAVDERFGGRPQREPVDLGQHVARRFLVNLGERPRAEDFLAAEYLEQVELDVPEIALVVAHVTPRVS